MKKYLYFLLSVLFFLSCAEQVEYSDDAQSDSSDPTLKYYGDNKFDVLGCGYDITGRYADGMSSMAKVLDVEKLNSAGRVTPYTLNGTSYTMKSGIDVVDFSRNMSTSLGLEFLGFSGSLNGSFNSSYKFNSKESFAYYSLEYLKKKFTINEPTSTLISYLDANFKADIANFTPEELVNKYGTHVLTNVVLGAKLEAFLKTQTTETNKTAAAEAKMGVSFKKLFGLNVSYSYNESLATKSTKTEIYYKTVGGDAQLKDGQLIPVDETSMMPQLDLAKWTASINTTVPLLIKLENKSLIPLYDLISDSGKKAAVKAYIEQYIKNSQVTSVDNYSSVGGVRGTSFGGYETQGASATIADINQNGIPDLILMGIDNPSGDNTYLCKILFDIDKYGNSSSISSVFSLGKSVGYENAGGSIIAKDINGNGIIDLVLVCADNPSGGNPFYYKIAFDISKTGQPKSISASMKLTDAMGNDYNDIGADIYDFNKNGKPDIIVMAYDDPKGANTFRYQILYDLDASGIPRGGKTQVYYVDGVGDYAQGSGVAVADINRNGQPDIFLTMLDAPSGENRFRYKILWDVDSSGYTYKTPTTIYPSFTNLGLGHEHQGGDCVLYDIDRNGILDVLFVAMDNPKGANEWRYITGFDFTTAGQIQYWR